MKGLYTTDLLQIIRLNKKGILQNTGLESFGIISSAIIDLINLERLTLTEREDEVIYIMANKNEITGNKLLDEIFLTIHDCPKEYTINEWVNRFLDSYNAFEKIHLESLIKREVFIRESKIKRASRYFILILLIMSFILLSVALVYYYPLVKSQHYYLINSNLRKQILGDLYNNIKSNILPDPAMAGLIIILKITGLNNTLIDQEYKDFIVKKYYQLQDHDFKNPNIKLFVKYLKGRFTRNI